MGLEIELEYDDDHEGVWAAADEAELTERTGRRWGLRPRSGAPLLLQLGVALAAVVLGASSAAGFVAGRTAQHDRGLALLHLAAISPFTIDPLDVQTSGDAKQLLATPWTDTYRRGVTLTVVNDSPDPVTVLGATLAAPEFAATALSPRGVAAIRPGDTSVLRGSATIVCGDFPAAPNGSDLSPAQLATTAQLRVRTADGLVRTERLLVDRYSDIVEQTICQKAPSPELVTATTYASTATRGSYTVTITVADRAPFPLRVAVPAAEADEWASGGGLVVQVPAPVTIPPHGSVTVRLPVSIVGCMLATEVAQGNFGFPTLTVTDARDDPGSPKSRETQDSLFLTYDVAISRYCGPFQQSGAGR